MRARLSFFYAIIFIGDNMGKLYLTTGEYLLNANGMDAVVNAANKYMAYGSGICGVIYRGAGNELLEYCQNTFKTVMKPTEARVTPGFNLNMDIIHVLSPIYSESDNPIEELLEAYKNMFNEIVKHKYKNVLVCSLGTGIYGYKHEDVAKPLMELLNNFCNNNDVNIYFNNLYQEYTDVYKKFC